MRRAREVAIWKELQDARSRMQPVPFTYGQHASIDLQRPCTVLGGRNGAGKTRLLRAVAAHLDAKAVYLDLHHLCEQALSALRPLQDIDEMKDELGQIGPDKERLDDISRVVGRDYERVEWFALDIGPTDESVRSTFRWSGGTEDSPLTPYFVATHAGREYGALDMGLGEFSVHFLFWILEQFKNRDDLTLLLDEPDAYLPPVGVERLLARLLAICKARGWRMIISTHSEEMISTAVEHDEFLLLQRGHGGETESMHSGTDRSVAETLLSRAAIKHVLFVEDESAYYLARALLNEGDRSLSKSVSIVWGEGHGYLTRTQAVMPRPPRPEMSFSFVPDGDQRNELSASGEASRRWPLHFLPTELDPDELFRSLKSDVVPLAKALHVDSGALQRKLDGLQGADAHDWVNELGEEYGRPHVLTVLAATWASEHLDESKQFAALIRSQL